MHKELQISAYLFADIYQCTSEADFRAAKPFIEQATFPIYQCSNCN